MFSVLKAKSLLILLSGHPLLIYHIFLKKHPQLVIRVKFRKIAWIIVHFKIFTILAVVYVSPWNILLTLINPQFSAPVIWMKFGHLFGKIRKNLRLIGKIRFCLAIRQFLALEVFHEGRIQKTIRDVQNVAIAFFV